MDHKDLRSQSQFLLDFVSRPRKSLNDLQQTLSYAFDKNLAFATHDQVNLILIIEWYLPQVVP